MKTYPDHAPAKIVRKGSAKGSIINYWPPRLPLSTAAWKRIAKAHRELIKLMRKKR